MNAQLLERPAVKPRNKINISQHYDHSFMPVIKISREGSVIYANKSGIHFLQKLGGLHSDQAVSRLIFLFPELSKRNCSTSCSCRNGNFIYHFNLVSFEEAGYVGLYGFQMERISEYNFLHSSTKRLS